MSKIDKDVSKEKERKQTMRNASIAGAQAEVVQRYGAAVKEHLVGYSGIDKETGRALKRALNPFLKRKYLKSSHTKVSKLRRVMLPRSRQWPKKTQKRSFLVKKRESPVQMTSQRS